VVTGCKNTVKASINKKIKIKIRIKRVVTGCKNTVKASINTVWFLCLSLSLPLSLPLSISISLSLFLFLSLSLSLPLSLPPSLSISLSLSLPPSLPPSLSLVRYLSVPLKPACVYEAREAVIEVEEGATPPLVRDREFVVPGFEFVLPYECAASYDDPV
jgi:hypothetical protein